MAFPTSPVEGQIYEDYIYKIDRWEAEVLPVVRMIYQNQVVSAASTNFRYTGKGEDTHNAYNTSTGEYTFPITGVYQINGSFVGGVSVTQADLGAYIDGTIYRQVTATANLPYALRYNYSFSIRVNAGQKLTLKHGATAYANASDQLDITRIGS